MGKKIPQFLKKLRRPLRTIEYVISIGILWAGAISVSLITAEDQPANPSSFYALIDQYELVSFVVLSLVILAVMDLIALSTKETTKSIAVRSNAMFGISIGFFFVSALTVLSSGINNLLWANEFNLALIAAILYVNLKVNSTVERQR